MKTRSDIITQALIFFLPALIATLLFQVNDHCTSLEEFTFYRCGLSGMFVVVCLVESLSISYTLASIITILFYSFVFFYLYVSLSKGSKKRMLILKCVNITLSVWGILIGSFMMLSSALI